jgi:hypothetical protein
MPSASLSVSESATRPYNPCAIFAFMLATKRFDSLGVNGAKGVAPLSIGQRLGQRKLNVNRRG